jgi:hypothetical protein
MILMDPDDYFACWDCIDGVHLDDGIILLRICIGDDLMAASIC